MATATDQRRITVYDVPEGTVKRVTAIVGYELAYHGTVPAGLYTRAPNNLSGNGQVAWLQPAEHVTPRSVYAVRRADVEPFAEAWVREAKT